MKRLLLLPLGLVLLASCKEKELGLIDFTPKPIETEFMAPVETPQQRIVYLEEFTGVTCPQCPNGHVVLKSIEAANPGRVAIVGIQPIGNAQTRPVDKDGIKTINENTTRKGTDLADGIYGTISAIPAVSFDRSVQGGSLLYTSRVDWPGATDARKDIPTKANVSITSSYNAANKQAVIKVHVAYTSPVSKDQVLNVALVENEVIDAQEFTSLSVPPVVQDYHHQHVFRDLLTTPVTGAAILGNKPTKAAGQVYERTFVYNVPATVLNPDNCRIVAFVSNNDGADKEVVQAAEAHLK